MSFLEINTQICNKDGICAAVCPARLFEFRKGEFPSPLIEAEEMCIRCGHCIAACPTDSIIHKEIPVEKCQPLHKELFLSKEQCEQFLLARRSIRAYREKSVPENDLKKLIEVASHAPTGANSQTVEWLVLGNRDELKRLAGITVDWMRWTLNNMPEIAQTMHLDRSIERWDKGEDVIFRGAPHVIVAHGQKDDLRTPESSTIALSYLELAATGMGLGCCWAGYFQIAAKIFPPMTEAIPLPKDNKCTGAMMVGYPKYTYRRLPLRKQPEITWRL